MKNILRCMVILFFVVFQVAVLNSHAICITTCEPPPPPGYCCPTPAPIPTPKDCYDFCKDKGFDNGFRVSSPSHADDCEFRSGTRIGECCCYNQRLPFPDCPGPNCPSPGCPFGPDCPLPTHQSPTPQPTATPAPTPGVPFPCTTDEDCSPGQICVAGSCVMY